MDTYTVTNYLQWPFVSLMFVSVRCVVFFFSFVFLLRKVYFPLTHYITLAPCQVTLYALCYIPIFLSPCVLEAWLI